MLLTESPNTDDTPVVVLLTGIFEGNKESLFTGVENGSSRMMVLLSPDSAYSESSLWSVELSS